MYLKKQGIDKKLTIHDTASQNGVAERQNRTIVERIRAFLHASNLPKFLWGEAAHHVVWLMNRTSTKAVEGMTPYEAAFGKKPNLRDVREWGEKVWVRVEGGNKLGGRVREGRLMGIDEQSKGIRIYWPDKMTVGIERNVYYDKSTASVSRIEGEEGIIEMKTDLPNSMNPTSNIPSDNPTPTPPHKPNPSTSEDDLPEKRIRKPSQRIVDIIEGRGSTSNRPSDPIVARGVQLPPPLPPVTEQPPNKVF